MVSDLYHLLIGSYHHKSRHEPIFYNFMNVPYVLVQHYIKQASGDVLRNENGNKCLNSGSMGTGIKKCIPHIFNLSPYVYRN